MWKTKENMRSTTIKLWSPFLAILLNNGRPFIKLWSPPTLNNGRHFIKLWSPSSIVHKLH